MQVRLLFDGLHNRVPLPVLEHLVAHGVMVREFHPLLVRRPDWLNCRLHDKLFIADGEHLIVGSRNLQDHHFGRDKINYVDRDLYAQGPIACTARNYFFLHWNSKDVRPIDFTHVAVRQVNNRLARSHQPQIDWRTCTPAMAGAILDSVRDRGCPRCCAPLCPDEEPVEELPPWPEVCARFLYTDPDAPPLHSRGIDTQMLRLMDNAQCSIVIQSPYIVLTHRMQRTLLNARRRGVAVRILTNSLASTDQFLAQAGFENDKHRLLHAGVEIWEFAGPNHLHGKSAVIDGHLAIVGSYNFDARSETENSEVAVLVDDVDTAEWLLESIAIHQSGAFCLGANGKPMGTAERYPGAAAGRKLRMPATRTLVPLVRRLL